jgi:hypothetical protein
MNIIRKINERGQSLVIIALGLLAFVAILALVLDGGYAYAMKRQAQNAADAGALAGATAMCKQHSESAGVDAARIYAVDKNGADPNPVIVASLSSATVKVTATVTKPTFFAGVIGFGTVSPKAVAEAACRPPGVGTLPVGWSCRENVVGQLNCVEQTGPCRIESDPKGLNCTYVLMDSVKVKEKGKKNCDPADPNCYIQNDLTCAVPDASCNYTPDPSKPNVIDCDLDNDCKDELMVGGARSWLDLTGKKGGADELRNWISGKEVPPQIQVHTWLPEQSGVATSIFHDVADHLVGTVVIVPVYNKVCNGLPTVTTPETLDQCNAGAGDIQTLITNSTLNFHVSSFSAFHVTCVQTGKKATAEAGYFIDKKDNDCYGHARAVTQGSIDENDKSIEGYFVRIQMPGYGGSGDWIDTGTFTVVLVK